MTYIIDLQRLWQESEQINPKALEITPGAPIDHKHLNISVVMVINSGTEKLSEKLSVLLKHSMVREIQLVNCHPTAEPMINSLVLQHPKCTIIKGNPGMTLVQAYQMAARRALGYLLLFLSPDVDIDQHTLTRLTTTGLRKPRPWAVGLQSEPLHPFGKSTTLAAQRLPEVFMSGGGFHVPALSNTCLLIPTTDYWELKGFDAACQTATFHLDFCMRIHLAGGGVYQIADEGDTAVQSPVVSKKQTWVEKWRATQGWWRYYQKHYSKKTNFNFGLDKLLMGLRLACRLFSRAPKV